MSRKVIDIAPNGEQWSVKERGAKRALRNFDRKADAISHGRRVAKKQPSSQLVVRKRDGTIQTEYTYGDDPFPPKG